MGGHPRNGPADRDLRDEALARASAPVRDMSDPASSTLGGRIALITGASSGIGAGVARAMAASGADVVLVGRHAERLSAVANSIRDRAGVAHAIEFDLDGDDAGSAIAA